MPNRKKATEPVSENEAVGPTTIEWEDPPTRRGRGATKFDWVAHLEPVLEHPNKWAKIGTYPSASSASSNAAKLRNGKADVPYGAGYWQFTTRKNEDDGTSALYALYLGDEDEAEDEAVESA